MADEKPPPVTGLESRPVMRYRAACTCGWRSLWTEAQAAAEADRNGHRREGCGTVTGG